MSEDDLPEVLFRARLYRTEKDSPWGFRLQGGVEFNKPLTLLKVIPDSIAAKVGLNAGDILVRLAGQTADSMTHRDAQQAIVNSGNSLEIIVERADVTCTSSPCIGSAFSDIGQLAINDLNSETYADERDDVKTGGHRCMTSEEGADSNIESFSEKILNEVPPTNASENDVSRRRTSATSQIQPEQHPSSSSASTVIPDSLTATTNASISNDVEAPPTDRDQAVPTSSPLRRSSSSSSSSSSVSAAETEAGQSRCGDSGDGKDVRLADGRQGTDKNGSCEVDVATAFDKGENGLDDKATDDRLKMADDRLKMTSDDRSKMTSDERLKMTSDERLKMTSDERLKMTSDDRLKMTSDASTVATVLTDHNDNIPLDHLEAQNSFPVRALLKTSALTSELGDESSEGADDQSSEFSDDVSVIEVPPEGTKDAEAAAEDEEDEDTVPDTDALFYQDETEYREISLLNFDDRFFEAAAAAAAARSSATPSTEAETDISRMKACFYLPSLVSPDHREATTPTAPAVTVQSLTGPVVTSSEVSGPGGTADKSSSSRDFSQTAPWRVSNRTGPSRRAEDLSPTSQGSSAAAQQIYWSDDAKTSHPIVSSYVLNDPSHTGPENVIYIPISIFGTQLKLGSQYTFQRKDPPSTSAGPGLGGVAALGSRVSSPPMSLTLMGRRSEDRHALRVEQQPPPPVDQPSPVIVVRSSDPGQTTTRTVSVALATPNPVVTMATARVYIAPPPVTSSGKSVSVPAETSVSVLGSVSAAAAVVTQATMPSSSSSSSGEPRRLSSEVLPDLQDIPLPPVRDIVADLNSRLERVAERYETTVAAAVAAAAAGCQISPSTELGTSFARPERRRSSSGSDSDREIIIDTPPFSVHETAAVAATRLRERLLGDQGPPVIGADTATPTAATYRSVIYRGNLSPKSIRRFSLPGGALTVKDSVQRRVRFAEPPESSVIEIEGRQRRWPTGERVRSAGGDRIGMRDNYASSAAAAAAAEADYVSVSSLAEKLDRIELENALASAAMKRSRPFQPPPPPSQGVSSLLASHPAHADIRGSSPGRSTGLVGRSTAWKLEPIQERVINIQTLQQGSDTRRPPTAAVDDRYIRVGSQKPTSSGPGRSPSDFGGGGVVGGGGGFSVSIGPGSGGQLSLSVQQHHPSHPNHGSSRHVGGQPPTKVNFVLPSGGGGAELGKPDHGFSYSVSTVAREPIKYTLPPTYEESVRAMASGKHPRSSSLDDAKQISMAAVAAAAAYPPRISELRAESQLGPGNYPVQPGLRIMRAQSPTLSTSSHPGWVISSIPSGQDRDARRGYSQTLQVDTGSKQLSRVGHHHQPPKPTSPSFALPVYHARSGALSSADLAGYHASKQETSPQQQDRLMRMMAQPPPPTLGHPTPGMRQAVSVELPRQDISARFFRSGSPLILSPTAGVSNPGSAKQSAQGTGQSFSPVSSPSGPDRRWPSHRLPDHLGQAPSPLTERRWPASPPRHLTHTAQPPFVHEQTRLMMQPSPSMGRSHPDATSALSAAQRLPGIFALLDKTFTDKVMQWEGGNRSGGLQQSETYKLVREMDDAMKQDKQ